MGTGVVSFEVQNLNPSYSIDQVLVPGQRTGYQVYNTFDTGTSTNDADIDPGQVADGLLAPMFRQANGLLAQDNVTGLTVIACTSGDVHADTSQNEPYAHSDGSVGGTGGIRDANEVYAKNRPILKPTVASLGQGAFQGIKGYKMGLGYSVERWYSLATFGDAVNVTAPLTDPMGFDLTKILTTPILGGNKTERIIDTAAGHVSIPARIAGPRYEAVTDGPGVLRVNDIDVTGVENFDDPHLERSDYGQTAVFNVRGDAQSFCLGGISCAGIVAFGAQGDLPITWSLKASLAAVDTLRSVSFTPADFDAWNLGWQNYYCGRGVHPALPLTPGTNSPDPTGVCPVVNPPETRPTAAPQVAVALAAPAAPKASTCKSNRQIKFTWPKSAKAGKLTYRGRVLAAKRSNGRLRATADLRGMVAAPGAYTKVIQSTTDKSGKKSKVTRSFKVC